MTLELKPHQLELNVVGWKEAQSDALKDWLQSVEGERVVGALGDYEVIAFARRACKKTPQSKPWWQDESVAELGRCPAHLFEAGWITRHMIGLGSRKEEKPAFHVRRAWPRADPSVLAPQFVDEIAAEVAKLLPLLRSIWTAPAVRRW